MRILTRTVVTAVAVAGLLTACSGGDEGGGAGGATSSGSSSVASSTDASSRSSDLNQAAADAGVDPATPPKPIASRTLPGKTSTDQSADLTLDVYSLKR